MSVFQKHNVVVGLSDSGGGGTFEAAHQCFQHDLPLQFGMGGKSGVVPHVWHHDGGRRGLKGRHPQLTVLLVDGGKIDGIDVFQTKKPNV